MNTLAVVIALLGAWLVSAKDISRSKRQMSVYYMCNNNGNSPFVSQYPCSNNCGYGGYGCNNNGNYNYNNNLNNVVLPSSFYSPNYNCNNGCSNLNCNQYNGQYLNGQYVAYSTGSNVYSPCASSCCSGYNPYNNGQVVIGGIGVDNGFNNGYNNGYNPYNVGASSFLPSLRSFSSLTGNRMNNGVLMCGGSEPSGGTCHAGFCPQGHVCVSGNICCRCAVGASAGPCSSGSTCPVGYACNESTQYCCASSVVRSTQLESCINGGCIDGFECGPGDLCYKVQP